MMLPTSLEKLMPCLTERAKGDGRQMRLALYGMAQLEPLARARKAKTEPEEADLHYNVADLKEVTPRNEIQRPNCASGCHLNRQAYFAQQTVAPARLILL